MKEILMCLLLVLVSLALLKAGFIFGLPLLGASGFLTYASVVIYKRDNL